MPQHELIIEGAKQNNLKNISLRLPHNKVIAVTGVSGSGKSSLAFETIFAEGQWRFIESLSTYARLFLEKLDRPLVDNIDNIRPAIALEQRNPVRGSRSTVGTLTEVYDFLRLLYSKVATPYCPKCGRRIRKWDASGIAAELAEKRSGQKAVIVFESGEPQEELKSKGFHRLWIDNEARGFEELPEWPRRADVLVDRLLISDEPRLADSIETAWKYGGEKIKVILIDGPSAEFSSLNACDACGIALPEPSPLLFSFNHPVGACPECKGFGNVLNYAPELIVPDPHLSLTEGAVEPWDKPAAKWWKRRMLGAAKKSGVNVNKPFMELSGKEKDWVFKGGEGFKGINDFFEELQQKRYKLHVRVFLSRYRKEAVCPLCKGKRLNHEALSYKIGGGDTTPGPLDIAVLSDLPVSGLREFFREADISPFEREMAKELLRQIDMKLRFLSRVGLDYLSLSRQGRTLSGGEYQRVNLSNQLSAYLTGTLYVLDEPTVGLHNRDTDRVTGIMAELASIGNTVVVVEHDRAVIEKADWIVELGPGGGHLGGEVVFSGPKEDFLKADTLTSRYIQGKEKIRPALIRRSGNGGLLLKGASGNNLKGVNLHVPLGTLSSVTGVSGSGKSSIVVDTLWRALAGRFRLMPLSPLPYKSMEGAELLKGVKLIEQTPIGKSPRSNPVTYLKIFDSIRKLFSGQHEAKAHGWGPGFFSFNVPGGRCQTCRGEGYQKVEMYFFEDLYIKCEECGGKRYGEAALRVMYKGRSINDILEMTVSEASLLFQDIPAIREKLCLMEDIGLGYLRLGQPATTLSGGEAQRLKICAELGVKAARDFLYILDEPTVGLHFKDVEALLNILNRLVDAGNTVLVIEHNLDLISASDYVIDLGPEGGDAGGRIIAEGTPEDVAEVKGSYTGRYLRGHMK
ncbi:MAG: excinuclease ABC subunit UvrA [Thermodesulfovibrionales bacterium]|nr:excinuclease ABC subunit UvrA [Thermodesulfovibrionales bacterium]